PPPNRVATAVPNVPRGCFACNGRRRRGSEDAEDALERLAAVRRAVEGEGASHKERAVEPLPMARLDQRELLSEEREAVRLLPAVDDRELREVAAEGVLLEVHVGVAADRRTQDLVRDVLVADHEVDEHGLARLRRRACGERRRAQKCERRKDDDRKSTCANHRVETSRPAQKSVFKRRTPFLKQRL